MLREIFIKNFAIIDDLRIRFSEGFTILSGETGAGKSIIINAVNLLLGTRANPGFIRTGADTAELSAFFDISSDSPAAQTMAAHDIEFSEGLMIRRIIAANNRHRIYINDTPSTIKLLDEITRNLVSISGQHAHQGLLDETRHLAILDQFGGLTPLREKVRVSYQEILPLIQKLDRLNALKSRQGEQTALLVFQRDEITAADIHPDEDAQLERELLVLKNSEVLYSTVFSSVEDLYGAQNAVVERLVEVKKQLEKASLIDPNMGSTVERLADAAYRIEDVVHDLRSYLGGIRMDEKRMEQIGERLSLLNKFKRKYGGSLEAVLAHLKSVEADLAGIENISGQIAETEGEIENCRTELTALALRLSDERIKAAHLLSRKVEEELDGLRMSNTRFEVSLCRIPLTHSAHPSLILDGGIIAETGIDRAAFLIAPNVGESLKPLSDIASGGELSRVILALKVILADRESVETVIFDEVDSGIGGGVAEIIGRKIASLSHFHQVVCITHLPQIARFGDHHFRISKQVSDGRTRTLIEPLNPDDRIQEIARMLGGIKMTQATLDHALEMFQQR